MDTQTKKVLIYATISTTAICAIYLKRDFILSLRQRYLARYVSRKHGHSHHGHGHSHSHEGVDEIERLKEALFHNLKEEENNESKKEIRILEIGVGTGTNFKYFPSKCLFVAVDPNPYFEESVSANLQKFPGIKLERRLVSGAEDMSEIESNSVNAVVATFVFCQVKNVDKVFQEILRILVKGGKFYYMDHLASDQGTAKRMLEHFVTYTGIARLIFNADLNRDIGKNITSSGFRNVDQKYCAASGKNLLVGVAEK